MGKVVMITGATSGIGRATARLLAQNGYDLVVTGRRRERLERLQQELQSTTPARVHLLAFDITDRLAVGEAVTSLSEEWRTPDILINNAGLAAGMSTIADGDTDDWELMINTNITGLLYITRLIAARMVVRGSGHIVNISSIAGRETYPLGNVYCATKHAVESLTKGMRLDFLKQGIKVSSVSPGAVETEFAKVRFKGDEERAAKVYEGFTPLAAEDIAETILFVVSRPAHVTIDDVLVMPTAQAYARDFHRQ